MKNRLILLTFLCTGMLTNLNIVAMNKRKKKKDHDIFKFIRSNEVKKLEQLVKNDKTVINQEDKDGCKPMHWTYICGGNPHILYLLMQNGARLKDMCPIDIPLENAKTILNSFGGKIKPILETINDQSFRPTFKKIEKITGGFLKECTKYMLKLRFYSSIQNLFKEGKSAKESGIMHLEKFYKLEPLRKILHKLLLNGKNINSFDGCYQEFLREVIANMKSSFTERKFKILQKKIGLPQAHKDFRERTNYVVENLL